MPDRVTHLGMGERGWLDQLLAPLRRGSTILDLGCGSGEPLARVLVDRGFRVTGIDIAAPMIQLARTRFPRERWILGDMRTERIDETFDGVLAWNCLSQLSAADQDMMAGRAARWLKPDGRLLFNAAPEQKAAGSADYRPGSRYCDDLDAVDYSDALSRRGLIEMAHVAEDTACGGVGVWLARKG